MSHLVISIVFSVQVWLANGSIAVQHDTGWSVPVEFGDRRLNAHHTALTRLAHEHPEWHRKAPKVRR